MEEPRPSFDVPSPYEYALISRLSYHDDFRKLPENQNKFLQASLELLHAKGWILQESIVDKEYHAHIWVNDKNKQVVIAHRGSQNATSWITDIESVVRSEPGSFIRSTIDSLSHPAVIACRKKGYRLSTTGHSLGGFLAQVCVYWSQRREMESTYCPDISAVVFDSPGVVDFLKVLQSNLKSEKGSIKLEHLNIHNFCAVPTLVSTYGTHTGTIWHLPGAEDVRFAFVVDHMMEHILKGFDPHTGLPINFRQMIDWPQADYSQYDSFTHAAESLLVGTAKFPFALLNALYKKVIKRNPIDTWYDKIFSHQGQVTAFLKSKNYRPKLGELEEQITLAIKSHYTPLSEQVSKTHTGLHHFDPEVQLFLKDLARYQEYGLDKIGLEKELINMLGQEGYQLLLQFNLQTHGDKTELVLAPGYSGNIFAYQQAVQLLLKQKGIPALPVLVGDKIKALQQVQKQPTRNSAATFRTAISYEAGAHALRLLDETDYEDQRLKEFEQNLKKCAEQGYDYHQDGAVTFKAGAYAIVVPKNPSESQAKLVERLGLLANNPSPKNNTPQQDHNPSKLQDDSTAKKP